MRTKKFGFSIWKMSAKDRIPFNPHVVIEVRSFLTGADNVPALTGNLMTEREIDVRIDRLKANLDEVARQAKLALRKAQRQTRDIMKKPAR